MRQPVRDGDGVVGFVGVERVEGSQSGDAGELGAHGLADGDVPARGGGA